jgi:hypothetical protein
MEGREEAEIGKSSLNQSRGLTKQTHDDQRRCLFVCLVSHLPRLPFQGLSGVSPFYSRLPQSLPLVVSVSRLEGSVV